MGTRSVIFGDEAEEIFKLKTVRSEVLRQRNMAQNDIEFALCDEKIYETEMNLWKIFIRKVAHVTDQARFWEFLQKIEYAFGEITFIPQVADSFDAMYQSLQRFVAKMCADARARFHSATTADA